MELKSKQLFRKGLKKEGDILACNLFKSLPLSLQKHFLRISPPHVVTEGDD